jgi:hypothetical protein
MGADTLVKREVVGLMRTSAASSPSTNTCALAKTNAIGGFSILSIGLLVELQSACSD